MSHDDMSVRRKRFEAAEKARKVALLEAMIRDFDHMAVDLAQQVAVEEERTKIRDAGHSAYSTFAMAASLRRCKLLASVAALKSKLGAAKRERDQAMHQLCGLESTQNAPPQSTSQPTAL